MSEKTVMVKIFGENYPITGGGSSDEVAHVAAYVDSKMNQVAEVSRVKSREKIAILAALSIASELSDEKQSAGGVSKDFETRIDSMLARLKQSLSAVAVSR
jgi:cell division protein ZapA